MMFFSIIRGIQIQRLSAIPSFLVEAFAFVKIAICRDRCVLYYSNTKEYNAVNSYF